MSASDLEKGTRWGPDIARQLESSALGIICLTPENVTAPWILFEAGALSKTLESTFVCPYLFELEPAMVGQPLGQFQATRADQEDTRKLLRTLNRALGDQALEADRLEKIFDRWWPDLEDRLKAVPSLPREASTQPGRSDRELLEEVLEYARDQERRFQDIETIIVTRLGAERAQGTFVLSPAIEELARTEANRLRKAGWQQGLAALQRQVELGNDQRTHSTDVVADDINDDL
jgi:hypothetical protein